MEKNQKTTVMAVMVALAWLFAAQMSSINAATVTNTYPGYPNKWEGLTTNTIIEINLDTPVAMVGSSPDIDYCVQKAMFNGIDIVLSDVSCETDVSADKKTITIHPVDVLGENGLYAYKITNVTFEGGGSQQNVAEYFETGNNPIPVLVTQVNETVPPSPPYETPQDMCSDVGDYQSLTGGFWCVRCHTSWPDEIPYYGQCVITP